MEISGLIFNSSFSDFTCLLYKHPNEGNSVSDFNLALSFCFIYMYIKVDYTERKTKTPSKFQMLEYIFVKDIQV